MYPQTNINRDSFQIENFIAVPSRDLLFRDDQKYTLEPLVMDLLCILAEHPGEVIMREDLIDRLWGIDRGSDESLTRAVSVLRKALRNAGTSEIFIETIPKRGYRLTRPVSTKISHDARHDSKYAPQLKPTKKLILPIAIFVLIISMPIIFIATVGN